MNGMPGLHIKHILATVLLALILIGGTALAEEKDERVAVVFDGSASMRGYYKDSIVDLNKKLHDLFEGLHLRPYSQIFVSTLEIPAQTYAVDYSLPFALPKV